MSESESFRRVSNASVVPFDASAQAIPTLGKDDFDDEDDIVETSWSMASRVWKDVTLIALAAGAWVVLLFGAIVTAVLHHFCQDTSDARNPAEAWKKCIALAGIDYMDGESSSQAVFLFVQVMFVPYTTYFGFNMIRGMFAAEDVYPAGSSFLKVALRVATAGSLFACLFSSIVLQQPVYGLTSMAPVGLFYYVVQYLSAKRLSDIAMVPGLVMPYMLGAFITQFIGMVYKFILPILITNQASTMFRGVFRFICHPLIFGFWLASYRFWLRSIRGAYEGMQAVGLVYILIYASIMGRFLLVQIADPTRAVVFSVLIACYSLVGNVYTRDRDIWVTRLVYGKRTAEALLNTPEATQLRISEVVVGPVLEVAATIGTAAIMTIARITPQDTATGLPARPDPAAIWASAFAQVVIILVADVVIGLNLLSRFHSIRYAEQWPRIDKKRLVKHVLFHLTFVSSWLCVDILSIFCPRRDESLRVYLEYCDSPSSSM